MYICPVCGYDGLTEIPYGKYKSPSYELCSCCGFQFGFDDLSEGKSYKDYREEWISQGAKWFSKNYKPENWSLEDQLKSLTQQQGGIMEYLEIRLRDFYINLLEDFLKNELKILGENVASSDFYSYTEDRILEYHEISDFLDIYSSHNTGHLFLHELNLGLTIKTVLIVLSFDTVQGDIIINFPANEVITSDRDKTIAEFYKMVEYLLQLKRKFSITQIKLGYESAYDVDRCLLNLTDNQTINQAITNLIANLPNRG